MKNCGNCIGYTFLCTTERYRITFSVKRKYVVIQTSMAPHTDRNTTSRSMWL